MGDTERTPSASSADTAAGRPPTRPPSNAPCDRAPRSPSGAHSPEPGTDNALTALADHIVGTAGRLAAATCRWLQLVAEFDARDGAAAYGMSTTTRWLAWACGLSDRTAIDHVRVARALAAHPPLVEEMTTGRLSYSQVRAISRVARPTETGLVADLIEVARHGTVRHVEAMVRGLRTVRDSDCAADPAEVVREAWTDSSQWRLSSRLNPERGAIVSAALQQVSTAHDLNREDALVRLAEIALAALADTGTRQHLRGAELAAVVVHVDAGPDTRHLAAGADQATTNAGADDDVMVRATDVTRPPVRPSLPSLSSLSSLSEPSPAVAQPGLLQTAAGRSLDGVVRPFGRLTDGPGLPRSVVERLACSGRVRLCVRDGRWPGANVLDLGRSRRLVGDRQFRALLLRQGRRCAHPGCARRVFLEAHHVRHWMAGGRTDMNNLVLLCTRHHTDHHDGRFLIDALGRGRFRFYLPDGTALPERPDAESATAGSAPIEADHPDVIGGAATTRWDGRRLDHRYAIAGLAQRLEPA